jgi:glycosyltransferase involved in cell wall biosynthesis
MALGLPSIVADCGGAAWAVKDAGRVFQPGDVDDLVGKIKSVYENPAMANEMGKKAENRAKDFDCSHTIPELIKVYRSLLP